MRIQGGEVLVNGTTETRRGRKLAIGDLVTIDQTTYEVDLATSFTFFQGGFSDGSTLSGSFTGENQNDNNLIDLEEVRPFNLVWTGRTEPFPVSFAHYLANLVAFDYNLLTQALFLVSQQNIIDATEFVE